LATFIPLWLQSRCYTLAWIPVFSLVSPRTDFTFSGELSSTWGGFREYTGTAYDAVDGQRIFNEVPQAPLTSHAWELSSNNTYSYYNFISEFYNS